MNKHFTQLAESAYNTFFSEAKHNLKLLLSDLNDDQASALAAMCLLPILKMTGETAPEFFNDIAKKRIGDQNERRS